MATTLGVFLGAVHNRVDGYSFEKMNLRQKQFWAEFAAGALLGFVAVAVTYTAALVLPKILL